MFTQWLVKRGALGPAEADFGEIRFFRGFFFMELFFGIIQCCEISMQSIFFLFLVSLSGSLVIILVFLFAIPSVAGAC